MTKTNGRSMKDGDEKRFLTGKYFCTTADVWKESAKMNHTPGSLDELWRQRETSDGNKDQKDEDPTGEGPNDEDLPEAIKTRFEAHYNFLDGINPQEHDIVSTKDGSLAESVKPYFAVDIFGNRARDTAQVAHLVPQAPQDREQWMGVAAAVLPVGLEKDYPEGDADKKQYLRKQLLALCGTKRKRGESGGKREANTGVVYSVFNKIRLAQQKTLLDDNAPILLIIPAITLEEARAWKGAGYRAVVLGGLPDGKFMTKESYKKYKQEQEKNGKKDALHRYSRSYDNADDAGIQAYLESKACLEGFFERYQEEAVISDKDQNDLLDLAQLNLTTTLFALAEYNKKMRIIVTEDEKICDDLKGATISAFKERPLASENPELIVPESKKREKSYKTREEKPLLTVKFGDPTDGENHIAPDPLLLLAKAAVVWGRMTGVDILANGAVDDDSFDNFEELAARYFIEEYRRSEAHIPKEIVVPSAQNRSENSNLELNEYYIHSPLQ